MSKPKEKWRGVDRFWEPFKCNDSVWTAHIKDHYLWLRHRHPKETEHIRPAQAACLLPDKSSGRRFKNNDYAMKSSPETVDIQNANLSYMEVRRSHIDLSLLLVRGVGCEVYASTMDFTISTSCQFSYSSFIQSNIAGNLSLVVFHGAKMRLCNIDARLFNCVFKEAIFDECLFTGKLKGCDFRGARLNNCNLLHVQSFEDSNFTGADLEGTKLPPIFYKEAELMKP